MPAIAGINLLGGGGVGCLNDMVGVGWTPPFVHAAPDWLHRWIPRIPIFPDVKVEIIDRSSYLCWQW